MNNWINVKDKLPNEYQHVLICGKDWVIIGIYQPYWGGGYGAFSDSGDCGLVEQPTHWMHLPAPWSE